ncbi:MAG TPA: hypothetical protein VN381_08200 [Anaerovoracaceae bacterium]|nr:hypothetical protein [Anaerovoracaceae bacterium]
MAIALLIVYGCKKIFDYLDLERRNFYEDEKVYQAADEFARGASSDEVKAILASCLDFDEQDAEEILSRAIPCRTDKDRGYRAFISSVNKILGEEVYNRRLSK